jgi:ATP-dependent Clp protease ATP-binding subunit ClpA
MRQLINILSKTNNNNVLLVGEPTSGIGSIVRHLAFLISQDEVSEKLFDKRLIMLSIENLISGATPQEITERVQKMINEILEAGNVILFIPDIHNLFKTSGENYLSAAEVYCLFYLKIIFKLLGQQRRHFIKKILNREVILIHYLR